MGLQFGAVLSGMATKIAERVEEEEKRVDLLTNRYLVLLLVLLSYPLLSAEDYYMHYTLFETFMLPL